MSEEKKNVKKKTEETILKKVYTHDEIID